jgi:hypothetical protein
MDDDVRIGGSAFVTARRRELLKRLLGEVRARRRRRQLARAAAAGVVVLLVGFGVVRSLAPVEPAPVAPPVEAAVPAWREVHDDPTVLARCAVAPVVRPQWFVDDGELQALLRADDRPAGVVRSGAHVFVAAAAVDSWPAVGP